MLAIHPRQASACELFSAKGSQGAKLEHAELAWTLDPMDHGYLTSRSHQGRTLYARRRGELKLQYYNIAMLYTCPAACTW